MSRSTIDQWPFDRGEVRGLQGAADGWRPGWDLAGVVAEAAADGSGPPVGTPVVGLVGRLAISAAARARRASSRTRRTGACRGHGDGRFRPSRRRSAVSRVAPHDRAGHGVVGSGLHRGAAVAADGGTRLERLAAHTAVAVRGGLHVKLPM